MMRRRPTAVGLVSLVLVGCVVVTTATACSGDDSSPSAPAPTGSPTGSPAATASAEPVETEASIDRVDGDLADVGRDRLQARVVRAVDSWIDGAYGGAYPRDDFSGAFDTFTEGAGSRATADEDLMSNTALGLRLDDVLPVRRRVRIDVLGVEGRAVAVTARVDLAFELSGEITRTDKISGSLYLTFEKSDGDPGWRVFGYDMKRKEV
ncbi:hypothetical protein BH09ACT12_BH09ACT12_14160 [soil metagenome]